MISSPGPYGKTGKGGQVPSSSGYFGPNSLTTGQQVSR